MTAATTPRFIELPNIAGIKEASGDISKCMQILRDRPENFLVVSGDDVINATTDRPRYGWSDRCSRQLCYKAFTDMVRHCLVGNLRQQS